MIVLGRIAAPYGVRGWVRLHAFGDDPASWREMSRWYLSRDAEAPEAEWQCVVQKGVREHGDGVVVCFDGITDRTAAENLQGMFFGVPREALPATREDEYYWSDLIGLQVLNQKGELLGRVTGLIETGAHEVLAVRDDEGKERLLPFIAQVVREVDLAGGTIRVEWELDW